MTGPVRPSPEEVVAAARRFLGTPYHHQAALPGAGCDCLGLVRGVWRDLYGSEPENPPPYTPDWGEAGAGEPLLDAARRHLVEAPLAEAGPGDVVVFRMRPGCPAKHAAILSLGGRMIHAVSRDRVREEAVGAWWARRAVAGFGWPGRRRPRRDAGRPSADRVGRAVELNRDGGGGRSGERSVTPPLDDAEAGER